MPERGDIPPSQERICKNLDSGVQKLRQMVETIYEREKRPVVVVISGNAHSGKSEFLSKYKETTPPDKQSEILTTVGFDGVNNHADKLKSDPIKIIIIEDVTYPIPAKNNCQKQFNHGLDAYVFIYNPNIPNSYSTEQAKQADLIIINRQSKVKTF